MTKVLFKRKSSAEIEELPIEDGSFIIDTDTGKMYIDTEEERIQVPGVETPLIGIDGTPSNTNTYHANAINNLIKSNYKETIIYNEKILGGQTISKDFAPYKRLLITYSMYDHPNETSNNAGTSGIVILDLTTNTNQMYSVCGNIPYNIFSPTNAAEEMGYGFKVNKAKTEFACKFHYKGAFQDNNQYYYVSKIVGIS